MNLVTGTHPYIFPPGAIAVIRGELSRFGDFCSNLETLFAPEGSICLQSTSYDCAANRNACIRQMMKDEKFKWVFLLDDDHTFQPDTLIRLLMRRVDVISPLCVNRHTPFPPISTKFKNGSGTWRNEDKTINWEYRTWAEIPTTGLLETTVLGGNGLLIQRPVLEKIGDPWFEPGQLERGYALEDVDFSRKVFEAGYKLYSDCDRHIGHMVVAEVWPKPGYGVEFVTDSGARHILVETDGQTEPK